MTLRITLAGRVSVRSDAVLIDEERLPGRQGRLVFAYLVIEQGRPVPRDELAEALWGETPPTTWEKALGVIASKLRALLGECGVDGAAALTGAFGCFRLDLPADTWVDLVEAERRVDEAEAALSTGEPERAKTAARDAVSLGRPPLLPGEDGAWVEGKRRHMADVLERALCCIADACLLSDDPADAARWAEEAIALAPFRESGYRRLMRAQAAAGNGAEALRTYERCRRLLDEELGAYPSPETQAIYRELLATAPAEPRAADSAGQVPELTAPTDAREGNSRADSARAEPRTGSRRPRRRAAFAAAALLALLSAAAGWLALRPSAAGMPPGSWTIGLDMPLSGPTASGAKPIRDAVQLAIHETDAAGGIDGSPLELAAYDDGATTAPNGQDPDRGAVNAGAMVADPRTIAMIGPVGSNVARAVLPVTNRAGLLECSPANTDPGLTKPRDGALDLRAAHPNRINYVRLAPSDDIQGPALASLAFDDLGARHALVIDDDDGGRGIADDFEQAYSKLGGQVVRRTLNPGADPMTLLGTAAKHAPGVVFFGGFEHTGSAELRLAMERAGLGRVPLLSWDGLLGGNGARKGSFIEEAGAAAEGTLLSHASIPPNNASFSRRFRAAFGRDPDEYAAAAYGCVEVIVASLRAVADRGTTARGLREALRAYAVDPTHRYETTLGTVAFDANGDSIQQFVTFYRVDPSAAHGAGDWVAYKQEDFGPAQ